MNLKNLLDRHTWLFWIVIPAILLWKFKDLLGEFAGMQAKAALDKARGTDAKLKAKAEDAEREAQAKEQQAKGLEQKISKIEEKVDLNWHLKKDQE